MELKHVNKQETNNQSVTLTLYGEIGTKVDGDYFAREIAYLSENYNEIIIKINSTGGSVIQGLSIVSAILSSQAKTVAFVEGIAASMAGVIAMAADKVKMNDFARIMVHNPYSPDKKTLSEKETKTLSNLTDMLNHILSRRGVDKTLMGDFMNQETWFTAQNAKELKMVDEIITTDKFKAAEEFINSIAANQLNSEIFNQFILTKSRKMEIVAKMLGLQPTDNEAEFVAKVNELKNEVSVLKAQNEALKAEKAEAEKAEVIAMVDNAIAKGLIVTEKKNELIELGSTNFNALKTVLNSLKPQTLSLSDTLKAAQASAQSTTEIDFEDLIKNPAKAERIKRENPTAYKAAEEKFLNSYNDGTSN